MRGNKRARHLRNCAFSYVTEESAGGVRVHARVGGPVSVWIDLCERSWRLVVVSRSLLFVHEVEQVVVGRVAGLHGQAPERLGQRARARVAVLHVERDDVRRVLAANIGTQTTNKKKQSSSSRQCEMSDCTALVLLRKCSYVVAHVELLTWCPGRG